MVTEPNLDEWNRQHIAVSQVLLGVISPNMRMVWLEYQEGEWVIHFVLEHDDDTDREEIDDSIAEFEALQDRAIACRLNVVIDSRTLEWPAFPARVVFRRREM